MTYPSKQKIQIGDWVAYRDEVGGSVNPMRRIIRLGQVVDEPGQELCRVDWGMYIGVCRYADILKIEFHEVEP